MISETYFTEKLHSIYKDSIYAFLSNLQTSDKSGLAKSIDEFTRTCILQLWAKFDIDADICSRCLSAIYVNEEDKPSYTQDEISEVYEYIRSGQSSIKIPAFFSELIEEDLLFQTTHSRAFAEGIKLIFIQSALIDDNFSLKEAELVTEYSKLLIAECDKKTIPDINNCINTHNYLSDSEELIRSIKAEVASVLNNKDDELDTIHHSPTINEHKDLTSTDPLGELSNLIGLSSVKKEIESIRNLAKVQQLRKQEGLPTTTTSNHLVFSGNPGTGKTTVARLLSKILYDAGVLSKGHLIEVKSNDLVAGYVGQTASKTHNVIESAKGGVLFIDEAYTLLDKNGQGYGQEAIDTLLKDMEDYRDDLVVVVAGYDSLITDFINSNPGLKSRFNKYIHFDDYNATELMGIFDSLCEDNKYILTDSARGIITDYFTKIDDNHTESFGNGREVRNLFERIISNQANRLANITDASIQDLQTVVSEDLGDIFNDQSISLNDALEDLNRMIGLTAVKQEIASLIDYIKISNIRKSSGLITSNLSFHFVFTGNPGTGKTTVARCLGKIFKTLGLLNSEQVVETDRSDLVAGYVGQTAQKTKQVISKALGGILFIDEAYTLSGKGGNDFGQEAIDTLLKEMEDNRDNLVVIVAGYDAQMEAFINSNPGLKSRFNRYIHFNDYSPKEMLQIFNMYCEKNQYALSVDATDYLLNFFNSVDKQTFGNGRGVRNIYEKAISNQATRLADLKSYDNLMTINIDDIIAACEGVSYE